MLFGCVYIMYDVRTTTRIECEVENWSQRERLKAPCHHSPVPSVSLYWLAPPILRSCVWLYSVLYLCCRPWQVVGVVVSSTNTLALNKLINLLSDCMHPVYTYRCTLNDGVRDSASRT